MIWTYFKNEERENYKVLSIRVKGRDPRGRQKSGWE
jgi:hypothetical protein